MAEPLAQTHHSGPWMLPWKVTKCLCSDGKRRTAWISCQEPDTFFQHSGARQGEGQDRERLRHRMRNGWTDGQPVQASQDRQELFGSAGMEIGGSNDNGF